MQWYVLRSKPNKEEALCDEVDARGIHVFYPLLRVKPANPRAGRIVPYFPGYLFVQAELAEVCGSAFSWMPHSQGLVAFGGEPAEVPDGLIQAIRRRTEQIEAGGGAQLAGIKRGETVVIEGGPFAGYEAIFDAQVAGKERARVLLNFLQVQTMKLELPGEQIRRAKRREATAQ